MQHSWRSRKITTVRCTIQASFTYINLADLLELDPFRIASTEADLICKK